MHIERLTAYMLMYLNSHVEMGERGDRLNKYKAKKCGLTSRRTADGSAISWCHLGDSRRVVGPWGATYFNLKVIVMVNLLHPTYLAQCLKVQNKYPPASFANTSQIATFNWPREKINKWKWTYWKYKPNFKTRIPGKSWSMQIHSDLLTPGLKQN